MQPILNSRVIKNLALAFSFLCFFFFSHSILFAADPTLPKASYLKPETVKEWLGEGRPLLLIDVREPKEYEAGHIEGALNNPYGEIEKHLGDWGKESTLVFYCIHSTWRAPYSANLFKDHGFQNAYILEGGIVAWKGGGQTIRASQATALTIAPYPQDLKIALYHPQDKTYNEKITLTRGELKLFDGKEGRPAYVAVNGKIYDVTQSRLWRGGEHAPSEGKAFAGQDLTFLIQESPHGVKELEKFPVVGQLADIKEQ